MTLSFLDKKREEYNDIGPAPTCTDLNSYENRIYWLKKAISLALKPIQGKKKSIVDAIQRQVLDVLEPELLALQNEPEYLRLSEEKQKSLEVAESMKNEETKLQLYRQNVEKATKVVAETSPEASIDDVNVDLFDLFYQDWYLNALTNTGMMHYPLNNKKSKKIVVDNLAEMTKKDFLKTAVGPTQWNWLWSGEYDRLLKEGKILWTVYVWNPSNNYFVLEFNDRNEDTDKVHGTVNINHISFYDKKTVKPDVSIINTAYIITKRKKYNYR